MFRQLLRFFAVTAAFAVGAATTELLLAFEAVRVFLGLATEARVSLPGLAGFFGIAVLAGIGDDGDDEEQSPGIR